MNRLQIFLLLLTGLIGVSMAAPPVFAAGNQDVKFALHAKSTTKSSKSVCLSWAPTNIPCTNYLTAALTGTNVYLYLVAAQGDPALGIGGISCGVQYGSNLLVGWQRCSNLEFSSGGWPASGGGNRITWALQTNCQRALVPGYENQGVHAIAGFFTIYAYGVDEFSITQNRNVPQPELAVADCNAAEVLLPFENTGSVWFTPGGAAVGRNPCGDATSPYEPSVLLHIGDIVSGDICRAQPTDPAAVRTAAPAAADGSADYFVYLLGTPVYTPSTRGVAGLKVGIDYQMGGPGEGLRVWSWLSCGYLNEPTEGWPADGTGNTISWSTSGCRRDELVNAGFFSVTAYSPVIMAVTGHPETGQVALADCEGTDVVFDHIIPAHRMGWVTFGGAASGADHDGCNPAVESCEQPIPVRPTTWGAIKAMYGSR